MVQSEENKAKMERFLQIVWREGRIERLAEFWTQDWVNHAAPEGRQIGVEAVTTYHDDFSATFSAFSDLSIAVVDMIAETDRVVTYIEAMAKQVAPFAGIQATGKSGRLRSMRIDRFVDGNIAEHWSVADMAGFLEQLRGEWTLLLIAALTTREVTEQLPLDMLGPFESEAMEMREANRRWTMSVPTDLICCN